MADPEDPFLARWSRRKRDTRRDRPAPDAEPERRDSDAVAAAPAEDKPPVDAAEPGGAEPGGGEPETAAEPLPDIDSLDKTSDFTVFLKEGVPEAIRRKALRRLWRSDPVLANLDGLNDYDEDFSAVGMVTEHLKTIYKVGKGYLDDEDEAPAEEVSEDQVAGDEAPGNEVPVAQTAGESSAAMNSGPEPDSPEPDSPEPDSPEPDSPEPDSPEPDSPEPDSPEPDSPKPDSPKIAGPGSAVADNAPRSGKLRSGKLRPGKSPGRSARNRRWGGFAG